MSTLAEKPVRRAAANADAVRARRAKLARIRRAEDKADYAIAVKVCARLDSGEEKALTREEAMRELGL